MKGYAWLVNLTMIAGIVACVVVAPEDTMTPSPVAAPKVVLADGMWGAYNEGMATQCAMAALAQGSKHKYSPEAIEGLFNQCVYDQGLTI